jgi:UDP-glucose 4-epimerase
VVPALVELLMNPKAYGKVFNVGSNTEISMRALAELVIKKTGSKSPIKCIAYKDAYPAGFEDMQRRIPNLARISSLIGFRPARSLDDILNDVIEQFTDKRDETPSAAPRNA